MDLFSGVILAALGCVIMAQFARWSQKPTFYDLTQYRRGTYDYANVAKERWASKYNQLPVELQLGESPNRKRCTCARCRG